MTGTQPEPGAIPIGLRPCVESMVGYRISGAQPGVHVGMPSSTVTLVLALDEPLHLVGADGRRGDFDTLIAGLHAAPAHILHDGHQHGVQIGLTPRGAALLLGGPPGEISGTSVDLGDLIGPSARRLHERLSETPDWSERFALVLESLFAHREPRWQPRAEVERAWQVLTRSRGRVPISEVAREVGWSPRYLGERFRAEFGHPPKTTARVLRFQESHRLVAAGCPLAEAAARSGYADQSHLNRDWLDFAGTSPTRWRRDDEIAHVQGGPAAPGPRPGSGWHRDRDTDDPAGPDGHRVPSGRVGRVILPSHSSKTGSVPLQEAGRMDTTQQTETRTDHNIWPGLTAADPIALRAWLVSLGFTEGILVEDGDLVQHSEMLWPEGGRVMICSARPEDPHFTTPVGGAMLYVITDQPDEVHARAEAAGAQFTRPMEDTDYGSRGFSILDPEGNSWSFGTYAG